jgi:hypothetical protein
MKQPIIHKTVKRTMRIIRDLARSRNALIDELVVLDLYAKKIQKVKKYYEHGAPER